MIIDELHNYRKVNTCITCRFHKGVATLDWLYHECNLDGKFKSYKSNILERTDDELNEQQEWLISHQISPNYICDDFEIE
jgi:hypothetical protein